MTGLQQIEDALYALFDAFVATFNVVFMPWRTTSENIKAILGASNQDNEQDKLTESWFTSKSNELQFVGASSGITSAMVSASLSWSDFNKTNSVTRSTWVSSLLLSLVAVATATQQYVALNRIRCHPNGLEHIRLILSHDGDRMHPSRVQLYVWQVPIMLLNFSILIFLIGLGVFVVEVQGSWVAIFFGCVAIYAGLNYLAAASALYYVSLKALKSP